MSERPDMRWQMNRCPICEREHQITPSADYCIPACGCYDDAPAGAWPCEPCGISHAWNCPHLAGHTERVAATTEPVLVEVSEQFGAIHRGKVERMNEA